MRGRCCCCGHSAQRGETFFKPNGYSQSDLTIWTSNISACSPCLPALPSCPEALTPCTPAQPFQPRCNCSISFSPAAPGVGICKGTQAAQLDACSQKVSPALSMSQTPARNHCISSTLSQAASKPPSIYQHPSQRESSAQTHSPAPGTPQESQVTSSQIKIFPLSHHRAGKQTTGFIYNLPQVGTGRSDPLLLEVFPATQEEK